MQAISTLRITRRCSVVCLRVCLSVCPCVGYDVSPEKTDEPIEMPLASKLDCMGPKNHVLDGVTLAPPGENGG